MRRFLAPGLLLALATACPGDDTGDGTGDSSTTVTTFPDECASGGEIDCCEFNPNYCPPTSTENPSAGETTAGASTTGDTDASTDTGGTSTDTGGTSTGTGGTSTGG